MAPLILYDLPSKGHCACWSFNPWKTRIALNYKGIEYQTEWLEYPDVAPTLERLGIPPNEEGVALTPYSIPTVRMPSGEYIMDSAKIAPALEKLKPEPSLRLDAEPVQQLPSMLPQIIQPLAGVVMPRVPRLVLSEKSQPYFYETREKRFGVHLDELEKQKGGDPAWAAAKEPIEKLAALLKKNGGPYFLGDTVCYADFMLASVLQFFKRLDIYDRFVAHDKAFDDLYKACAQWLERDDH